VKMGVQKKNKN